MLSETKLVPKIRVDNNIVVNNNNVINIGIDNNINVDNTYVLPQLKHTSLLY